ncbi:MAG: dodecin domain-containing protein [Thermotogae bacterium]|nr:dodecin domain-containing protein [Thermotogota bacterium]
MAKVYKKIELIGISTDSIEDAIRGAIERASKTLKHLAWYEVKEIRGSIEDGKVKEYQVVLLVAFRVEERDSV